MRWSRHWRDVWGSHCFSQYSRWHIQNIGNKTALSASWGFENNNTSEEYLIELMWGDPRDTNLIPRCTPKLQPWSLYSYLFISVAYFITIFISLAGIFIQINLNEWNSVVSRMWGTVWPWTHQLELRQTRLTLPLSLTVINMANSYTHTHTLSLHGPGWRLTSPQRLGEWSVSRPCSTFSSPPLQTTAA